MKLILEFDQEMESEAAIRATKATDAYLALYDLREAIREYNKLDKNIITITEMYALFDDILYDRGINLNKELT
jgi:hypothetical protein